MDKSLVVDSNRFAVLVQEINHHAQLNPHALAEGQKQELVRAAKKLVANLQDSEEAAWLVGSGVRPSRSNDLA